MDYCENLLKTLNEFRVRGRLCDVELLIGKTRFPAHRNILCASSIFFNGLFSSGMKEEGSRTVSLQQFPVAIMDDLLTYLYTGKLEISDTTAQDFLSAADFLLLSDLKGVSETVLANNVNLSNCIYSLHLAETFSCKRLEEVCFQNIMDNFGELSTTDDFRSLSYRQMLELVSAEDIVVRTEEQVYEGILHWIGNDKRRKECFVELFSELRLFSMDEEYLDGEVLTSELVQSNPSCIEAVQRSKTYCPTSPYDLRPRTCLDDYADAVILCNRAFDAAVVCFVPGLEEWFEFQSIPGGISWQCLAYCNGGLYVVSGNGWSGCLNPASLVYRYDPIHNAWSSKAPLLADTDEFGMGAIENHIYVAGGHNRHGVRIELVQRYDTCSDTWELVSPLLPARSGACVASHGGRLYVFGGSTNEGYLQDAMMYDPLLDSWSQITPMTYSRSLACATVVGDHVYVISGHSDEAYGTNSVNDVKPITACEGYDVSTDTWDRIPDITLQRSNAGVVYVNKKIYTFGGDDMISFAQQGESMEYFDLKSNQWSKPVEFSEIRVNVTRPRACAMRLSKSFIQTLHAAL